MRPQRAAAPGRARPRLADRHARRREGARGPLRALSRTPTLFTLVHVPGSVSPAIERLSPRALAAAVPAGASRRYLPLLPAALPDRRRAVRPRRLRPGRQHEPLRGQGGASPRTGAAPLLLLHPDALRLGPVRRVLRAGAARDAGRRGGDPADAGRAGAVGRRDRGTRGPLSWPIHEHVARRIRRYYNRDAVVVYPPVDTDFYRPDETVPRRRHV